MDPTNRLWPLVAVLLLPAAASAQGSVTLDQQEVRREGQALAAQGFRNVLLVAERPSKIDMLALSDTPTEENDP